MVLIYYSKSKRDDYMKKHHRVLVSIINFIYLLIITIHLYELKSKIYVLKEYNLSTGSTYLEMSIFVLFLVLVLWALGYQIGMLKKGHKAELN